MTPNIDLTVAIITLNEEESLPRCLRSLPPGCEIIVLDSGSKDRTVDIAKEFKARVETRAFDHYAAQKNAALDLATRGWVFSIDADEECDQQLRDALNTAIGSSNHAGFKVKRRLHFLGRRMRFGKTTDCPLRLIKRQAGSFKSEIHETLTLDQGSAGCLEGELTHYSYANITDYFVRFNNYTSKVAANHSAAGKPFPYFRHLVRPWTEFLSRYFLRLGFLDGYPGYCYALLSSTYTFVKYAKYKELLDAERKS
jgi:glycosyltransferase involved in cell wall biosynthesis